ncbi:MAG: NrtA/SsuA/CpmA family ABC transporter substrate-binding protein [Synergistaceae bacterium]|jgi:sulfonate transport system substrate-binding protein|nr:NrtA/SsuA/CpmA family ABC transporter substrate-binding protein [Synergistaceae bacterium]
MKRGFWIFALLPILIFLAVPSHAASRDTLRISGWKLPFNLPVMVELERGAYEKSFPEFNVSIVDMRSGPNLMAALAAGEIDIAQGIGDAAFLVAASAGIDARVIAVNSRSPKAFAVVSNSPDVKKISDLKGKKVAGLRGSVVHEVFLSALSEEGMTEADVEFFPMPLANAASALLAGRADAALLVGSDILKALKAGAVVLADGEGRVRGLSFVVVRSATLREHPEVVSRFIEMRRGTLDYMKSNPETALEIAARDTKQEASDIASIMALYDFDFAVTSADVDSLAKTKKYLMDNKIIREDVDIPSLFAK